MYGFLKGVLSDTSETSIILDVHDVGYLVSVSEPTRAQYQVGEVLNLYIYTHVSEQNIALYGFVEKAELELFKMLISVSGVGPKSALSILATPYGEVESAILMENYTVLQSFPGIGKKTAERIVVELKSKLSDKEISVSASGGGAKHADEAVYALMQLGFTKQEALHKLKNVDPGASIEELIKQALNS